MPGREGRAGKRLGQRSNPLGEDIQAQRFASQKHRRGEDGDTYEEGSDDFGAGGGGKGGGFLLHPKTTQKIFRRARDQLTEIELEARGGEYNAVDNEEEEQQQPRNDIGLSDLLRAQYAAPPAFYEAEEENDDDLGSVELEYDDNESIMSEMPMGDGAAMAMQAAAGNTNNNSIESMYGIDEEEARLLQRFQPASRVQSRHLAGVIMEKIKEKTAEEEAARRQAQQHDGDEEEGEAAIDPRIARVYTAIGTVLKRYTSGKIPKAFKVLPNVQNWENLVLLTKPDQWSPHAVYQATRIFSANLNEAMAQRFYAAILLPIVHERLLEEKKLHPALYMAVRKALFKPVAFFKGFLLPLALDEECTLREALVIASILQRSHLPPVPTAVTLVKIAQQPFRGPCSVFLRVLIDKQMSLPYQAIDALVGYFYRFLETHSAEEVLPVLWHQTLLSFVQRYKNDLQLEQLKMLHRVCSTHFHYLISPEIKRELAAAQRNLQTQGKS